MLSEAFHFSSLAFYLFLMYTVLGIEPPSGFDIGMPNLKENWWQYFTCWNLAFQGLYFSLCVSIDLLKSTPEEFLLKEKEKMKMAADVVFQSLVLPSAQIIVLVFWTIFTYDRELIFPAKIDAVLPSWVNHCIHSSVIFFALAEMTIRRKPFCDLRRHFLFGIFVMVTYNVTLVVASNWQGQWTYPILGVMSQFERNLYYCCMYVIYIATYSFGCLANAWICGEVGRKAKSL